MVEYSLKLILSHEILNGKAVVQRIHNFFFRFGGKSVHCAGVRLKDSVNASKSHGSFKKASHLLIGGKNLPPGQLLQLCGQPESAPVGYGGDDQIIYLINAGGKEEIF